MEDNFSTDQGWGRGDGSSGDANDGEGRGGTGSDGEQQVKLRSLTAGHSRHAVQPGSSQAADQYQSAAQGLGTPELITYTVLC